MHTKDKVNIHFYFSNKILVINLKKTLKISI